MKGKNLEVGKIGEDIASDLLINKGFHILDRHFTSHWGEIDIIARLENKIAFVEVKTRIGIQKGSPYEAFGFYKRKSLKRAIQYYLLKNNFKGYKLSIDMVSIVLDILKKPVKVQHFENIDSL